MVTALAGNSCNPDYSFYQAGSRTQWNPVEHLDIGLDITYTGLNTAYKGAGVYAANASRPSVFVFDDQGVWSAMSVGSATSIREDPALVVAGSESRDE